MKHVKSLALCLLALALVLALAGCGGGKSDLPGTYKIDLDLAPALTEALAKDQLLTADRHLRLSEVPALEAIVDRMHATLKPEDLDRVRSGDLAPLNEQVRDPALRAAVAHELNNESDLGQSGEVGPWADLARAQHRAAELGQRDRAVERDSGHEL